MLRKRLAGMILVSGARGRDAGNLNVESTSFEHHSVGALS